MQASGSRGGPGRARSCWEWIRAREYLLGSGAHVFAMSGSGGKHGLARKRSWRQARLARKRSWRTRRLRPVHNRGRVGGQGGAQNCGEWMRVSGYMLVSATHVFPCQDVAVGCARGLYLIVLPSSAVLAQSIMAARGCVGSPGCARSCWECNRAHASLLASSAQVLASVGESG